MTSTPAREPVPGDDAPEGDERAHDRARRRTLPPEPPLPRWLVRAGAAAWRLLAVAAALWALALLIGKLTVVVVPIAVALLLAGILEPVVRRVQRPGWPDWPVPLAAVLAVLTVVVAVVLLLGVRIADQLPQLRDEFTAAIEDLESRFSVQLPSLSGVISGSSDGGGGTSTARQVISVGVEVLFGFFLTLALTFLFLKDGRSMWAWLVDKVGGNVRDEVDEAGRAAWSTLGTYVRGLTVVALFDAVGIGLGLLIVGVPLVATLAVLQFIASYVPTIGAFVAGALAVAVAFSSGGLVDAAIVLAIVVVVQQIGNDVIEPWIMGHTLALHPAVVLIAVTAGAILWGIPGALLFVPLAAAASAAGHVLWIRRRDHERDPAEELAATRAAHGGG